jgi:hypothetical protein
MSRVLAPFDLVRQPDIASEPFAASSKIQDSLAKWPLVLTSSNPKQGAASPSA